jgi:hypothetical protein
VIRKKALKRKAQFKNKLKIFTDYPKRKPKINNTI